jgi:hypothetical protein
MPYNKPSLFLKCNVSKLLSKLMKQTKRKALHLVSIKKKNYVKYKCKRNLSLILSVCVYNFLKKIGWIY